VREAAAAIAREVDLAALAHPGWLLLLLPAIAVALAITARSRPAALGWPGLAEARAAGARRFDAVRGSSLGLRAAALVALACVLAGPVGMHRAPPEPGYGLDLVLVLDASGSMRAVDTEVAGERRTRLDLARQVVTRFAGKRAAAGDRVALVVFGESAFTPCPLTSDGDLLASSLTRIEAGVAGEATALGDALALAVKRAIAGRRSAAADGPLTGRVVVLLTDGRNNAGSISIEIATELASAEGVRVHTIAIGTAGEEVPMAVVEDGARRELHFERHDVDAAALERIAEATQGRFFPARRSDQLEAVYRDIDALERVVRPLPPRVRHRDRPEPLLALAGGCLIAEIAMARVLRRRIP
jgi:Ca-activated chloride channel family protein